nr:ATP-binding protein [Microbulbifer sediminum]
MAALHGYRESMAAAQELFDRQLAATAQLVGKLPLERARGELADRGDIALQIWAEDGRSLLRSANTPEEPLARLEAGYREVNFGGYRWRVYTYFSPPVGRWIQVAERSDLRYRLAEKVVLESVLPTLIALPVAALLIWLVVGRGLSSLRDLAEALRSKRAEDLEPLELTGPPEELLPVVQSTNALLARLRASFERERRFSADAAHELRTPISSIQVHLYNLEQELEGAGWKDGNGALARLRGSIRRMAHLVEQMLVLFRTNPEHYPARFEQLDLHQVAREVIAECYQDISAKQQSIELQGERAMVEGDHFAVTLLMNNLLNNASKYTPEGGAIVMTTGVSEAGPFIQVEDSGPGIAPAEREKIFARFYRVGGDRHQHRVEGSGLGLSIVEHIAQLHRASLELGESRFASGLKVGVVFPKGHGESQGGVRD